jgi:hypothetical protein
MTSSNTNTWRNIALEAYGLVLNFKKFMNVNKTKFVDKYINYNIEQYNQ